MQDYDEEKVEVIEYWDKKKKQYFWGNSLEEVFNNISDVQPKKTRKRLS